MENLTLKIGFINVLPYTWLKLNHSSTSGQYSVIGGIETQLWQLASEYYNFSIEWIIEPNSHFGAQYENGSWSGLIAAIMNNEIDLAVGGLMPTTKRLEVVDFLFPYDHDQYTFANQPLPETGSHMDLLIRPFHYKVFICILFTVILFWLFNWIEKKLQQQQYSETNNHHNLLWINFCLLVRQPYHWMSSTGSAIRIALIIWAFSSIILVNFYLYTLCSMLALPLIDKIDTINKFIDACNTGYLIPMAISNTSVEEFFLNSQVDTVRNLWSSHLMLLPNYSLPFTLLLSSSNRPYYALIAARKNLLFLQSVKGKDKIYLPPYTEKSSLFPSLLATPVQKGFHYKRPFERFVSRLITTGIMTHWEMLDSIKLRFYLKRGKGGKFQTFFDNTSMSQQDDEENVDDNNEHRIDDINFIDFTIQHLQNNPNALNTVFFLFHHPMRI
nr:glutamate receptor 2-like isoform X2 [Dermatophagoides farinae]